MDMAQQRVMNLDICSSMKAVSKTSLFFWEVSSVKKFLALDLTLFHVFHWNKRVVCVCRLCCKLIVLCVFCQLKTTPTTLHILMLRFVPTGDKRPVYIKFWPILNTRECKRIPNREVVCTTFHDTLYLPCQCTFSRELCIMHQAFLGLLRDHEETLRFRF